MPMKHKLVNSYIKENYIENLLKERGIEDVEKFLHPSWSDIQDPFDLDNMEKGIRALLDVVEKDNSRILLIVDSDMDGYSSSAIIYSYIKRLKDIQIDYSLHTHKQHGLEEHIDEILNSEIKYDLIICPDSASNDKEYIDQLDCPVLILDHHLVDKEISENAILINNQSSNAYLNKELSGGGVTWQFCRALDKTLGFNFADDYIDLAAFSIIGDMMGLKEIENQAIIHHGTQLVQNKFLKVLCEKQDYSMGGKINPTTVAFYIVPLVNAMIRVGTMEEKNRLFQAFVDGDKLVPCNKRGAKGTMERVAVESARECVNAKSHQDKEKVQMADKLEGRIYENGLLDNKVLVVELNDTDTFSSELNGLVCMYLSQKFQRPTAVVRRNDEGFLRGSCRGLNESELTSFKNFMDESGLFEYTAGHDQAYGCSLPASNLDKFIAYANEKLASINFSEGSYDVNFERHALDFDLKDLIYDIAEHENIYGQQMSEPLIYIDSINLKKGDWRVMGQKKDTVAWEKNGIKYIQFHANDLIEELESYPEVQIEIVGRATINEWMGTSNPQIMIKNYEIHNGKLSF